MKISFLNAITVATLFVAACASECLLYAEMDIIPITYDYKAKSETPISQRWLVLLAHKREDDNTWKSFSTDEKSLDRAQQIKEACEFLNKKTRTFKLNPLNIYQNKELLPLNYTTYNNYRLFFYLYVPLISSKIINKNIHRGFSFSLDVEKRPYESVEWFPMSEIINLKSGQKIGTTKDNQYPVEPNLLKRLKQDIPEHYTMTPEEVRMPKRKGN